MTAQRKIRDGGTLVATPAPVRAADTSAAPVPSPARVLQQTLHARSGDFRLPHHHRSQGSKRELSMFIIGAIMLWGGALGGIGGLMILAK